MYSQVVDVTKGKKGLYCSNQSLVKYVIVLNSNTFPYLIDLAWCNWANQEETFWEHFTGSNTLDKLCEA